MAILFCFVSCSNSSSSGDDYKANPFAGTEWSGGGNNLKFYTDGTVGGNSVSVKGLRYKVDSSGDSYTATIYTEVAGNTVDFATFTISSENASSGSYKLSGVNGSVTLKKVGGSSSNVDGNDSSDNATAGSDKTEDSDNSSNGGLDVPGGNANAGSNNNDESNSKGIKGGTSGDQFMNTLWSNDEITLSFTGYGAVHYSNGGYNVYYDYYFEVNNGSYIAKAYDNNYLMFTFSFSISNPSSGGLIVGSNGSSYSTLKRGSLDSIPDDVSNPSSGAFLIGTTWEESGVYGSYHIVFDNNDYCIISGTSYNYTYSDGRGEIRENYYSEVFATFTISGDMLTLIYYDGRASNFYRL